VIEVGRVICISIEMEVNEISGEDGYSHAAWLFSKLYSIYYLNLRKKHPLNFLFAARIICFFTLFIYHLTCFLCYLCVFSNNNPPLVHMAASTSIIITIIIIAPWIF